MLLQLVQLVQCLGRTGVRSTQGLFKHACEFRMEASSSDVVALCQLPTSSLQLQCLQVQMEFHTCKSNDASSFAIFTSNLNTPHSSLRAPP